MLILDDLIWAATTFGNHYDNDNYQYVFKQGDFIETLRFRPAELNIKDIRDILVDFLNKWGCRLKNYDDSTASNLKTCLIKTHSDLLSMQQKTIFDLEDDFGKEKIENIFNSFWFYGSDITKNFGPTATSKTLHLINPRLFTMWDEKIRLFYWVNNEKIIDSGQGYYLFLLEVKVIADSLIKESEQRTKQKDPALWLSEQLGIEPPMSIVKFIDQYNWLRCTKRLERPKGWTSPF